MKLIVTRPKPAATRTASKLRGLGHEVYISPVLEIVDTGEEMPNGDFSFIIITSANALMVLGRRGFDKSMLETPLYAVGDKTADQARAMGFRNVYSASGNAKNLAVLIGENENLTLTQKKPALYISGVNSTQGFTGSLKDAGLSFVQWANYKANLVDRLTNISAELLINKTPIGILLYSPRSAQQFSKIYSKLIDIQHIDNINFFVISEAVKNALPAHLQNRCKVASLPNESSLFDLLKD